MKNVLIQINSMLKSALSYVFDKKIHRTDPAENLCCKYLKQIGWMSMPQLGIVRLNMNYCMCCGRKITHPAGGQGDPAPTSDNLPSDEDPN